MTEFFSGKGDYAKSCRSAKRFPADISLRAMNSKEFSKIYGYFTTKLSKEDKSVYFLLKWFYMKDIYAESTNSGIIISNHSCVLTD